MSHIWKVVVMRLCSVKVDESEEAAVASGDEVIPVKVINETMGTNFSGQLLEIIKNGETAELSRVVAEGEEKLAGLATSAYEFAPPYRNPPKLWGFGPNFRRHAEDLETVPPPNGPGSYMRPVRNMIGPGDTIILPPQSNRVTAEAELGVVIGRECRNVTPEEAKSVIYGYTTILDMTAEDLLRENLRYIARAKGFDTFCSIGPYIVTEDEVDEVEKIHIATKVNGEIIAEAPVSSMVREIPWLLSFHSQMTTLEVGDIIATGTPGAGVIRHGDVVEADVRGIGHLRNHARAATAD
ncbi:fumarylacetoacetate hydrolase family protein [Streptomyces sp. NPDC050759]|uniref:fumarylacetoacetate hydrolase family protein n=1 Tax=Streptomyces sp. NPDC050759 TaxID=3365635 RepID=UPI0037908803